MAWFKKSVHWLATYLKIQNSSLQTPIDKLELGEANDLFLEFPEWKEILSELSQDYKDYQLVEKYIRKTYTSGSNPLQYAVSNSINERHQNESLHFIKVIAKLEVIDKYLTDPASYFSDIFHDISRTFNSTSFCSSPNPIELFQYFQKKLEDNPNLLKIQDSQEKTPINILISRNHFFTLDYLMKNEAISKAFDFQDKDGNTYLHQAICQDVGKFDLSNIELVKYLCKKVNVNMQDNKGRTVLHLALKYHKNRIILFLLGVPNIDLTLTDEHGESCLHYACKYNILSREEHENPGKFMNYYEDIMLLFNKPDLDINAKNDAGKTAFHYACKYSNESFIRLFLSYHEEQHINLNEQDDNGNTPVEILSSRNNPELGDLCIDLMIAIRQIEGTIEEKEEGPAHDIWSDMDYMNDDVEESSNNSGADTD